MNGQDNKSTNYGTDAPWVQRGAAGAATVALLAAVAGTAVRHSLYGWPLQTLICSGELGYASLYMWWSSRYGKLKERDRLISSISWRGDDLVLDVGCGRGLATIAAAKRVTDGQVIGIDIWSQGDLSDNSAKTAYANANAESVSDRVEFKTADVLQLPFGNDTFDKVISMTALHNIKPASLRATALSEMVRVLKPGGQIAIFDILHTRGYRKQLTSLSFRDVRLSSLVFLWGLPGQRVTAIKSELTK